MNKNTTRKILIPALFAILVLFAINVQTTLWFALFHHFAPPVLWPTLFVYLFTTRPLKQRLGWLAFFFLILTSYTVALPLSLFLSLVSVGVIIRFTQKRFSAIDTSDLILFSALSTLAFPLIYAAFSLPITWRFSYSIWEHLISIVLSVPCIPPLLAVSKKIDRVMNVEDESILLIRL